jgi:hypothetical protein
MCVLQFLPQSCGNEFVWKIFSIHLRKHPPEAKPRQLRQPGRCTG